MQVGVKLEVEFEMNLKTYNLKNENLMKIINTNHLS